MNFTLAEIRQLLELREDPQHVRDEVSALAGRKLDAIEKQLCELITLRNELSLLIHLCRNAREGCPILESLSEQAQGVGRSR